VTEAFEKKREGQRNPVFPVSLVLGMGKKEKRRVISKKGKKKEERPRAIISLRA